MDTPTHPTTPRVAAIQGPYTYNHITGNVDRPNGVIIARVYPAGLTKAQQDATGLLMAAAPELLALARRVADHFGTGGALGRDALALIAKAEGR